jgi:hypothetical protein
MVICMTPPTLADLERALRASWAADTCDPDDYPWHAGNPARGQCGVTALVLQDLLGGDLMLAEVHRDGRRTGMHWWNRLSSGIELDLTRDQFHAGEIVGPARRITRPPGSVRRGQAQYELLRHRVLARLTPARFSPAASP